MSGLVLKDLYVAVRSCKMIFLIDIVFVAVSFFSKDNIIFSMFPILNSGMLPITFLSLDERCKWTQYSGTLPYSRAQIVSAKYITGLIIQALTSAFIILCLVIRAKIFNDMTVYDIPVFVGGIFAVSLVMPALCLPLCFKFGTEKGRYAYFILCGLFAAAAVFFAENTNDLSELIMSAAVPFAALAVVAVFALSWVISAVFYRNKELG